MQKIGIGGRFFPWTLLAALTFSSGCEESNTVSDEIEDVVFDEMAVPYDPTYNSGSEEECTTGCSLAKHHVPEFSEHAFEKTLRAYAETAPGPDNAALETLLFYGSRTRSLMEQLGTGELKREHLEVLNKELTRDHAMVSLRMVNDMGKVRVSYGPSLVPIGTKQHLGAVGENLSSMEFNGTVMRTGVNYLWARY